MQRRDRSCLFIFLSCAASLMLCNGLNKRKIFHSVGCRGRVMHLNSLSSCLNLLGRVCSCAAVGSLVASSWCLTNTLAPPCLLQGCLERFWQEQKGGRSTSGLSRIKMIPPVSTDTYTILKYTFFGEWWGDESTFPPGYLLAPLLHAEGSCGAGKSSLRVSVLIPALLFAAQLLRAVGKVRPGSFGSSG